MHSGARNPKWIPSERLHLHEIKSLCISHITCTAPLKAHPAYTQPPTASEYERGSSRKIEGRKKERMHHSWGLRLTALETSKWEKSFSTFLSSIIPPFCAAIPKWNALWCVCVALTLCGYVWLCMFKLMSGPLFHTEMLSQPHRDVKLQCCHTHLTVFSSLPAQMLSIGWQEKNTSFINRSKTAQRETQSSA